MISPSLAEVYRCSCFPDPGRWSEAAEGDSGPADTRFWSELPSVRLWHMVHDEILLEAPEALAQAAANLLLEVMQDPVLQTRFLRDASSSWSRRFTYGLAGPRSTMEVSNPI